MDNEDREYPKASPEAEGELLRRLPHRVLGYGRVLVR